MSPMFRAAGFAAASLLAVIGTAYAAPAPSWDSVPISFTFLDHGSASLQGGDLGLNPEEGAVAPSEQVEPAPEAAPEPAVLPAPAEAIEAEPAPVRRTLAELV